MSEDQMTFDDIEEQEEFDPEEAGEESSASAGERKSRFWKKVPTDWVLVDGSEVYEVNPRHELDEDIHTYIEMDSLDTELPFPKYYGERDAEEYSGKTFTAGDTLFARITPCTENGKSALVPQMETRVGVGSTEFAVLSPNVDKIIPWYLYYLANSYPVHNYAVSRMRGSTGRQRVPFDVFRRELDLPLPSRSEQRKIASVLYNIDESIRKTEEIIEQTKRVKKGVMQEVFAEGYHEHEGYRETKYGKIPEDWGVTQISEIARQIQAGGTPDTKEDSYYGGDIYWVKTGELSADRITETEQTITQKGLKESTARLFPPKTVLVAMYGATTGEVSRLEVEASTNQACCGIVTNDNQADSRFLHQQLLYLQDSLIALSAGSGQQNIRKKTIENFDIMLPSLAEQKEIADALENLDSMVRRNQKITEELTIIKHALMQDLLTGTVRTKDADIDILDEVKEVGSSKAGGAE